MRKITGIAIVCALVPALLCGCLTSSAGSRKGKDESRENAPVATDEYPDYRVVVGYMPSWSGALADVDMSRSANPLEPPTAYDTSIKQTVEMRSPDGSADLYQLLAGLCVACRHGFEMKDALEVAERTYVNVNIHAAENASRLATLDQLPDSCVASAACLERQRKVFEEYGVFSPAMIDGIIAQLLAFKDETLRRDIEGNPGEIQKLVLRYFHCG